MKDQRQDAIAKFSRDENGLLKNVDYLFKDDGSIDWRRMVKTEHLYPNEAVFAARKKEVPPTAEGLKDNECIISLAGIKDLLSIRGYTQCKIDVISDTDGIVTTKCGIMFIPSYETGGKEVYREEIASAGTFNISPEFANYKHAIAANRAFARCVRNFLNIHIVSDDEIGDSSSTDSIKRGPDAITPYGLLKTKSGGDDAKILDAAKAANMEIPENWREDKTFCRRVLALMNKKV